MLHWTKRGLVFETARQGVGGWMRHSALTPTPYRINERHLRVYAGFRDQDGVSRIGYVDTNADDPTRIVHVGAQPALDVGRDGCFDDNGVILGDVVDAPGGLHLFYVGFQRVAKAKFLAFTGLAISTDGGTRFERAQETPLLDRAPGRSTIAAVHSVMYESGLWRLWYACGDDWELREGRHYPRYHIRYVETRDLQSIPRDDHACLLPRGSEYRIGRPRVYRLDRGYAMYFTRGNTTGEYFPGFARSTDGIAWERDDAALGLELSASGWDSCTLCYPALIRNREKLWMFYNGNDMGIDGFGVAEARHLAEAEAIVFTLRPYVPSDAPAWDALVHCSRNGNLLHLRDYMDYHADRFVDRSLVVERDGKISAIFPASLKDDRIVSHGGLTYAGLIRGPELRAQATLGIFESLGDHYRSQGVRHIVYKAVPHIFHSYPAEEDLYALHRMGARLVRRDISSAIALRDAPGFTPERRRSIDKARRAGIRLQTNADSANFHALLTTVLQNHGAAPTHSLAELRLLSERFRERIVLHEARLGDELLAGVLTYDFGHVVHTQYLAASEHGRRLDALSLLLAELIETRYLDRSYFSFGVSSEQEGRVLNTGLVEQKERFGARAVVHDCYEWTL